MDYHLDDMEDFPENSEDDSYLPYICRHGIGGECDDCDEEIEADGGIDKCLNCGRYKSGNQLNRDQVCINPCINPNEY